MRVESASGGQERRANGSRPDRRAFLRVGAGCALPLVAGGALASRGLARSAEAAAPGPTGQDAVDPVLAHIEQELARTYHAMRGPAGVRGEHVRSLAANLELVGVCLQARKDDVRAEAAIRRRIEDKGRDETAQECLAALDDLSADIAVQHGIVRRTTCEPARVAAALDAVAAKGLTFNVRGHKAVLNRLAAAIDREEMMRGGKAVPLVVRQKPGDDFLGYPELSVLNGMTLCDQLEAMQFALSFLAAFLAIVTEGAAAGVLALIAILLDLVKLTPCKDKVA
jgi:hypothetical protein